MNLVIASSKFWKECSYRSYRTVSEISFNTIPPSHPNISIKTTSSNLLEEVLPPKDLQVNSKLGFSNNTWSLRFPLPPLLTFVGSVVALLASSERPDGYWWVFRPVKHPKPWGREEQQIIPSGKSPYVCGSVRFDFHGCTFLISLWYINHQPEFLGLLSWGFTPNPKNDSFVAVRLRSRSPPKNTLPDALLI